MLGRNPMRIYFNHLRLNYSQSYRSISSGIIVAMACLILAAGCSRLGSNGPLSNRRIPFPPQPLREATNENATTNAVADTAKDLRSVEDYDFVAESRSELNPARDQVQNLKARPPKLSDLPRTTLYAEPTIDKAAQVAFQQEAADFNPAAEPPAQIFSQPLSPATTETTTSNAAKTFAQNNAPSVNPGTFVVPDPTPEDAESIFRATTTGTNETARDASQRIMLVTDQSPAVEPKSTIAQVSATDFKRQLPIIEKTIEPTFVAPKVAEVRPAPLLPAVPKIVEQRPKTPAIEAKNNGPRIDASLQGETYAKSASLKSVAPAKTSQQAPPKIELPKIQTHKVDEIRTVFGPAPQPAKAATKKVASSEPKQINGIEIDPTLSKQREERLNFAPRARKESVPEPAPVVYQKKKAPFLMLPPTRKPIPEVSETRIASIKRIDPIETFNQNEFVPVRKCVTCKNPDCKGCNIPAENQFSQSAPAIRAGRSLAPMSVETPADAPQIAKRNFGQVAFTPANLPLPQTVVNDAENIVAAFNQYVPDEDQFATTESQTDVPAVGVEAVMKLNAVTWRSRLHQTIGLVEKQLEGDVDSETRTSLEINLRLLDVLSRQMGDIAQEERTFTESENQFWQHQLEAITSMMRTSNLENGRDNNLLQHQTAHETLVHLRQAIAELESLANLKVESGAFCTEVSGYGQFKTFPTDAFRGGQKVLLYCEVENYNSEEQAADLGSTFHTRLRGSYAIYDSSGHAVQQAEFPVVEDVARRRRRDFYMHLPITIGDLSAGNYELHLLVEDLNGNKTASLTPPLMFSVSPNEAVDLQARAISTGKFVR